MDNKIKKSWSSRKAVLFLEKRKEVNRLEVKINREIRDYTESMFFGLSLRQFFFSLVACGVAVGLYFLLRPMWGWKR